MFFPQKDCTVIGLFGSCAICSGLNPNVITVYMSDKTNCNNRENELWLDLNVLKPVGVEAPVHNFPLCEHDVILNNSKQLQ